MRNAMVAVGDILGIKRLILNNSIETLRTKYLPDIYNTIRSSIIEAPSVPLSHEDIVRHGYVGHAQFNDMVIIYSLEDHPDAHRNVINATYHLLALSILFPYIRFRIGISYGEFYYDRENNIYIGKAFLEALELAEYQEWVGAAIAPLAYSQLYERDPLKSIIVEYNVPLKKGHRFSSPLYAINWTRANHEPITREKGWMPREFPFAIPYTEEHFSIVRKIENTECFHAEKCNLCKRLRERRYRK